VGGLIRLIGRIGAALRRPHPAWALRLVEAEAPRAG